MTEYLKCENEGERGVIIGCALNIVYFWDRQSKQIAKKVTGKIKNNQEKVKKCLQRNKRVYKQKRKRLMESKEEKKIWKIQQLC